MRTQTCLPTAARPSNRGQVPSAELINEYAIHLLYGAEAGEMYAKEPRAFEARMSSTPFKTLRKAKTVFNYIYAISAVYKHWDVKTELFSNALLKRLTNMRDSTYAARSFHLDEELKKIYDTVCGLRYWDETKKLMYWTMTLASAACVSEPCHTRARTHGHAHSHAHAHRQTHSDWGMRLKEPRRCSNESP